MELPKDIENQEIKNLQNSALLTFVFLSSLIIASAILIWQLKYLKQNILIGSILGGIMGCSTAALLSSLERKAQGWEIEDGTKYPTIILNNNKKETKDRVKDDRSMFSKRMLTFFIFRPVLGISAAYLIYFGFTEMEAIKSEFSQSEAKLLFWSILAGLFAKTLFGKMSDVFKNILG